jgi:1-acyl-sn-glycerol-3-phosphate acyltransferase
MLLWAHATLWLCKRICGLDFTVQGKQHIPENSSVVLLKHSSTYETIVQLLLFPNQTWVLKRELMWAPFLGWALAALRPIAINRRAGRAAVQQVVEKGQRRLEEGTWVMIFPEGTRMKPDTTRPYGLSGTLLAQASGRSLLPVAHNSGNFWPRRGWRKYPGTVRFCIGPPVDPSGRDPRAVNTEIQNWIEEKITEINRGY